MKIAAITVLYYPDDTLIRNIESFISHIDFLILWDNTPGGNQKNYHDLIETWEPKIIYKSTGKNEGLAYAYNQGLKFIESNDFTHYMTMDQDSCFEGFDNYVKQIENNHDSHAGIHAPVFNQSNIVQSDPFTTKAAIQSGSVFKLDVFKRVGYFREDFFIDAIDIEFCIRVRTNGFKIYNYHKCNLIHQIGSCRIAKFGIFKFSPSDYSPLRRFYLARNNILLMKEYPDEFDFERKLWFVKYMLKSIVKILLGENNKFLKIQNIIRGLYYGFNSKFIQY